MRGVMHSELFSLFGLQIQMYGVMLALGFLACYLLAGRLAKLSGRNPRDVDTLVMVAAVCGVLGARAVYVWQNWRTEFAGAPLEMFAVWRGGLVFYGGFGAAVAGLIVYALVKGEKPLGLLGFAAVFVPLGHAFGRVGCFFHGCCFGGICQNVLGVRYPAQTPPWKHQVALRQISQYAPETLPTWPTQLIEAAGCLVLFGGLWVLYRRLPAGVREKAVGGVYLTAYALLRFGVECLRDDPRGATYFGLSFSQTISVALLALGVLFLILAYREANHGTIHRQ